MGETKIHLDHDKALQDRVQNESVLVFIVKLQNNTHILREYVWLVDVKKVGSLSVQHPGKFNLKN